MIGKQLEKGRVKQLLIAGAILNGGGFMLLSKAGSLSMFYICYVIVGIGAAIVGPALHSSLPAYWFEKKRGLAVGLANIGAGAGSIIAPMIITATIASYDWRMAFFVLGAISAVILIALVFIIKTKPSDVGLYPDGLTKEQYDAQPKASRPVLKYKSIYSCIEFNTKQMGGITLAMKVLLIKRDTFTYSIGKEI